MRITTSEPKYYLVISGKGLITYLGINTNVRSKFKKARYASTNVSLKDLSNIFKEFSKLPYKGYVWNRPKHELIESYFYLARNLDKSMVRADAFNSHVDTVQAEITGTQQIPISHI